MPDAAELVQRAPQLRLEHEDDRDDDVHGRVPEQPRQEDEVEGRRDDADDGEQDEADQDLRALRSPQQSEHLVEDEGDHGDVDHLDGSEMTSHLDQLKAELADYIHQPKISPISA